MATKIYGSSDDLIEFDGDVSGEVSCYGTDEDEKGVLVVCSDGTLLEVKYGKGGQGMWEIRVIWAGSLFDHMEYAADEDENYSDIAHFVDGLKWAYAATGNWEKVH